MFQMMQMMQDLGLVFWVTTLLTWTFMVVAIIALIKYINRK